MGDGASDAGSKPNGLDPDQVIDEALVGQRCGYCGCPPVEPVKHGAKVYCGDACIQETRTSEARERPATPHRQRQHRRLEEITHPARERGVMLAPIEPSPISTRYLRARSRKLEATVAAMTEAGVEATWEGAEFQLGGLERLTPPTKRCSSGCCPRSAPPRRAGRG